MSPLHKDMVWLDGTPKTPPVPSEIRIEAGIRFRLVQAGVQLGMPHSCPMPCIGKNCHELRITGIDGIWRFFYFIDSDAIVNLRIICKKTQKTPQREIELCKSRLKGYLKAKGGSK